MIHADQAGRVWSTAITRPKWTTIMPSMAIARATSYPRIRLAVSLTGDRTGRAVAAVMTCALPSPASRCP